MALLGTSTATGLSLETAASQVKHAVRFGELTTLLAGLAPIAHLHSSSAIADMDAWLLSELGGLLLAGSGTSWGGTLRINVTVAPSGGITFDGSNRLQILLASGGAAPFTHTHSGLHNAVTVTDSSSVDLTLAGQDLSAAVILAPAGGLEIGSSGVQADGTVSRSSHTHAQLHDAVTIQDTGTVDLNLSGQELSATVKFPASPGAGYGRLVELAGGLAVDLGSSGNEAAAGNHTHPDATSGASGFMSAADKALLDAKLHDALTVSGGRGIAMDLADQNLMLELRLVAGGGLELTSSGLQNDSSVSRSGHAHAQLHDAVTVSDSSTVDLTLSTQLLSAAVKFPTSPETNYGRLAAITGGLAVVLGSSGNTSAAGNHSHSPGTVDSNGFISSDQVRILYSTTASFFTISTIVKDEYLVGHAIFSYPMNNVSASLYGARPTTSDATFELEVDGTLTGHQLLLTSGSGYEHAQETFSHTINSGQVCRWKMVDGPTDPVEGPHNLSLNLKVHP